MPYNAIFDEAGIGPDEEFFRSFSRELEQLRRTLPILPIPEVRSTTATEIIHRAEAMQQAMQQQQERLHRSQTQSTARYFQWHEYNSGPVSMKDYWAEPPVKIKRTIDGIKHMHETNRKILGPSKFSVFERRVAELNGDMQALLKRKAEAIKEKNESLERFRKISAKAKASFLRW